MKRTLTALVQDRPSALHRVMSLFRRRGLQAESLTVTRSEQEGVSQMTWVVDLPDSASAERTMSQLAMQLKKLIEVIEVRELPSRELPSCDTQSLSAPAQPSTSSSTIAVPQADGAN